MAKRPKQPKQAKQAKNTGEPAEKSVLIPILLWLLALVGFFNLLIGAYLYTAYQNHKDDARTQRTTAQAVTPAPVQSQPAPAAQTLSAAPEPEAPAQPETAPEPEPETAPEAEPETAPEADGGNLEDTENYDRFWPAGQFLGTVNSDKYHCGNCTAARKIPPENEVWYASEADAQADGRTRCGICYR